mgnify:CR=1 FL=1
MNFFLHSSFNFEPNIAFKKTGYLTRKKRNSI